jgi:predicted Ser/Thr protein kinase
MGPFSAVSLNDDAETLPIPVRAPGVGTDFKQYRIIGELGSGGVGVVLAAHDTGLNRPIALKILRDDHMQDTDSRERLFREAKSASALNHPHIVTVYEAGEERGCAYIAMEFIGGKTLHDCMANNRPPLVTALQYAIQIADALAAAQDANIVHRDLKPTNIMVSDKGAIKLVDFGVAKSTDPKLCGDGDDFQTARGFIVGTYAYMSPEQAEGRPVDHRSDIFSFGSVLYEMLTGRRPFEQETTIGLLSAILHEDPTSPRRIAPDIPPKVERIVLRCLCKAPDERWQHALDMKHALEDILPACVAQAANSPKARRKGRMAAWRRFAAARISPTILAVAGTSWIGLFSAYVVALILTIAKFTDFTAALQAKGMPEWSATALIAVFPLLVFVISTLPSLIEQRRIKHYGEISGLVQSGYFTLRPREAEDGFERADGAHHEVFRWIRNTREPVLYLTGASGTGKTSVLDAWVIPKLRREGHVVIHLRGYEDLFKGIKGQILQPGLIWAHPPVKEVDNLRSLLDRACRRLGANRLIIVVDQFEEVLILKDDEQRTAFQQFLSAQTISGLTFLLVFRPEYEGLIQDQAWPRLHLNTNRRVISPFTENAANDFLRRSGLILNPDLLRAVLRESTEIEQGTIGLIRPVTINLCGLVLSRFSSGLPRKFRGGIIRGFLSESLLLPEVRYVAEKIIPNLITDNVTRRPRTISEVAEAMQLTPARVLACMRRLGESDRAIVRPLDEQEETWEISHDFLVPLLDSIVARRTLWRRLRPWAPWVAVACLALAAVVAPLLTKNDPRAELRKQGWTISDDKGVLLLTPLNRKAPIPPQSISILRTLPLPYSLDLERTEVADVSALRDLKGLTTLNLESTQVADVSPLRDLKSLSTLDLGYTQVSDLAALRDLNSLTTLNLRLTQGADVSALAALKSLKTLDLRYAQVSDVSALRHLKSLTTLNLGGTKVVDVSALRDLKGLTTLDLGYTPVADVSALRDLKSLTMLHLGGTQVGDVSALRDLKSLTTLDLSYTQVGGVSALRDLW